MKIVITDKSGQVLYDGSPDLHGDGVIIGSASDCDIQINKIGIALAHIQIRYNTDGVLTLQDLQSPYGTVIDGVRLQPGFLSVIRPGSFLELCDDVFVSLQPEPDDIYMSNGNGDNRLYPFFLSSNESFVRKTFASIRSKLPREYHQTITGAEGELVIRVKELAAVLEVAGALNNISSFPRLMDFVLEMAIAVTGAERAMVLLFNEEFNRLETMAMSNFVPDELTVDMKAISVLVNKCYNTGEAMTGPAFKFRNIVSKKEDLLEDAGICSLSVVPLMELGSAIGVLYVDTKHPNNIMSGHAEEMLKVFASQLAVAITRIRMFHDATIDVVTGISNQNMFMRRLGEEFSRAQRHRKDISMILMDIDNFKGMNKTYGENACNRILKETARVFKNTTRINDVVARIGTDSFAMLLPETSFTGATVVASKLKSTLEKTNIRAGNNNIKLTGSFGVSASSASTVKPADLVKGAEKALKLAQKRGGNQIA